MKRLIKRLQREKKKPLHEKLEDLITKSDDFLKVFTRTIENLKGANEDLDKVATDSQDIANRHIGLANNALGKIEANKKTIKRIEEILG